MNRLSVLVGIWAWGAALLTISVLVVVAVQLFSHLSLDPIGPAIQLLSSSVLLAGAAVLLALPGALSIALTLGEGGGDSSVVVASKRLLSAVRDVPPLVYAVLGYAVGLRGPLGILILLVLIVTPFLAHGIRNTFGRARRRERLAAVALGASPMQVLVRVVAPASGRAILGLSLRAVAKLIGLTAPLLLIDSSSFLTVELYRAAEQGNLGSAATGVLVLVLTVFALHGGAAALARTPNWRPGS